MVILFFLAGIDIYNMRIHYHFFSECWLVSPLRWVVGPHQRSFATPGTNLQVTSLPLTIC